MARQEGHVQPEQSNMRLGLIMAKMAKGVFSRAAIEATQYFIKKPHAEVREEKQQSVEIPRLKMVKAAIERHPAMLGQNHTTGCHPCPNGTANNPHTQWRCKVTDCKAVYPYMAAYESI